MKAVVLKANRHMDYEEVPLGTLAADMCRVSVRNVGVCSSDIYRGCDNGAYSYPLIMGHELAGEVVATGSEVENIRNDDRVVIFPLLPCFQCEACVREMYAQCRDYDYYGSRRNGGYAEYIDVKAWNLLKIPDRVSFSDASAVEPLAVVLHALHRAKIDAETTSSIAIIGAGFLGLLMAQVLVNGSPHSKITMIDRNQFKLDIASLYSRHIMRIENESEWTKYLKNKKATFDIVIEASGTPSMFARALDLAAPGGHVVWMSNITGDLSLPKNLVSQVLRKELSIQGTWNSRYLPGKSDDWTTALDLIEDGLKPSELVTHWIGLTEVPDMLLKLYDHKTGAHPFPLIKAMVTI